jgi:hypothetical protein
VYQNRPSTRGEEKEKIKIKIVGRMFFGRIGGSPGMEAWS